MRLVGVLSLALLAVWAAGSLRATSPPQTEEAPTAAEAVITPPSSTTAEVPTTTPSTSMPPTSTTEASGRPAWLGRPLPLRPDGFGEVQPTPPELEDRRLPTVDLLPPPPDEGFVGTIDPVPEDVLARSTWEEGCPVGVDDLRYLTVSFFGFDERFHTGELIVHADASEAMVGVFQALHAARFPIEEMRVIRVEELDLPPTGDGNVTTGFVCRPAVGSSSWSRHALGLAIDVNPFHNPYLKADLVLPELASAYTDREWVRPGMVLSEDPVIEAFAAIGWEWGGEWRSVKDWMHFSADGR